MIANTEREAEKAKGKLCEYDSIPVLCSEIRRFGGIWHGWMYHAAPGRGEAVGWIPLPLVTPESDE